MKNYFKKIKMEDVNEIIKKNGFYYIPTEVLYTDFVGPKYIVATDDPQFKQKHPELAGMVIVSVAMFAEMAKEYNRYFANEVREKRRQSRSDLCLWCRIISGICTARPLLFCRSPV